MDSESSNYVQHSLSHCGAQQINTMSLPEYPHPRINASAFLDLGLIVHLNGFG